MPDVKISGEVSVGNKNFFGVNSTVLQQIHIGNETVIGASSLVLRKTKDGMTYVGNPASIIKY
jgi:acetyltransferase-like isoleucine patch superfamily enzyme